MARAKHSNVVSSPYRSFALVSTLLLVLALTLALAITPAVPAMAQGCGLPRSGHITTDQIYTLSSDCSQLGRLEFGSQLATTKITVTINGGNNTIYGTDEVTTILVRENVEFSINNVTFVNGGRASEGALTFKNSKYSATISNVTFDQTYSSGITFDNSNGTRVTHSLSSILINNPTEVYLSYRDGYPVGIHTIGPVNLNINRIVLRDIDAGNAAVGANDNYVGSAVRKGTITFSGCLTADGVMPPVYYGNIVIPDNIPACTTDPIGNGGTTAMQYTQKDKGTCGMPDGGWIYGSHTFTLSGTCTLSETLIITGDADVVIDGGVNKRTIDFDNKLAVGIRAWGKLTLRNVVITGALLVPLLDWLDTEVRISDSTFQNNGGPILFQDATATLNKVTFENNVIVPGNWQAAGINPLASAVWARLLSQITIIDSVFDSNTGGLGPIYAGSEPSQYGRRPFTRLLGEITLEGNSPRDIADPNGVLKIGEDIVPSGGGGGRGGGDDDEPTPVPISSSACYFCPALQARGFRLRATYGLDSGVQFRQLGRDGIGDPSVLNAGFMDAVDVWGYAEQGVEVCFPGTGSILLLDATTSPRTKVQLDSYTQHGMTCAALDRPGTLVLVGDAPDNLPVLSSSVRMATAVPAATAAPALPPGYQTLSGCMVTTQDLIRFRDAPGGAPLTYTDPWGREENGWLPSTVTLTALERTANWFKVDYYGTQGWVHADYVTPQGTCG